MLTCIIRYEIEPYQRHQFENYARNWGQAIPRCGARLIGYFAPHEGTTTTAYGIYDIEDLAAYEAYRARLAADPLGRENYALAQRERFIRRENRQFYRLVSTKCRSGQAMIANIFNEPPANRRRERAPATAHEHSTGRMLNHTVRLLDFCRFHGDQLSESLRLRQALMMKKQTTAAPASIQYWPLSPNRLNC